MGGGDQPTATLGGVATWRLGLVGAPGQAEQEWLEEVCYAEMAGSYVVDFHCLMA